MLLLALVCSGCRSGRDTAARGAPVTPNDHTPAADADNTRPPEETVEEETTADAPAVAGGQDATATADEEELDPETLCESAQDSEDAATCLEIVRWAKERDDERARFLPMCEKLKQLNDADESLSEAQKNEMGNIDRCTASASRWVGRDPERFAMMTDCAMKAADVDGYMKCMFSIQQSQGGDG